MTTPSGPATVFPTLVRSSHGSETNSPAPTPKISSASIPVCAKGHQYRTFPRPRCNSCITARLEDPMLAVRQPNGALVRPPGTRLLLHRPVGPQTVVSLRAQPPPVPPQSNGIPPNITLVRPQPASNVAQLPTGVSLVPPPRRAVLRPPPVEKPAETENSADSTDVENSLLVFPHLPTYKVKHVLFGPSSLRPDVREGDCEVFQAKMRVPPEFVRDLRTNRLDVQLRVFAMKPDGPEIAFPAFCEVTFNGFLVGLNGRLSATTIKRSTLDAPLTVTGKFNMTSLNTLKIRWKRTNRIPYYVLGVLVRKQGVNELLAEVQQSEVPKKQTDELIRKAFPQDDDVRVDTVRIPLTCPCSSTRISTPARSSKCEHLRCFDLKNFILLNEKRNVWKCPVCCKEAPLNTVMVDKMFVDILKEMSDRPNEDVEFFPDGTWRVFQAAESNGEQRNGKAARDKKSPPIQAALPSANVEILDGDADSKRQPSPFGVSKANPQEVITLDEEEPPMPTTINVPPAKIIRVEVPPPVLEPSVPPPPSARGSQKRKSATVRCESPSFKMLRIECVDENGHISEPEVPEVVPTPSPPPPPPRTTRCGRVTRSSTCSSTRKSTRR
ncbi:hypothetical protein M3Y99_00622000 [Aphelenchoides fujianensis]|nr:hypothetical protein M3Y99_00622000 [Aphelenchoides fujianensis]